MRPHMENIAGAQCFTAATEHPGTTGQPHPLGVRRVHEQSAARESSAFHLNPGWAFLAGALNF